MSELSENSVALVTGGSSGIGRATALLFGKKGAKVVVADIAVETGEETVQMLRDAGGEGIFFETDVTKAEEVEALINKSTEAYGRLDYAFNNAGGQHQFGPTADVAEEFWDNIVALNLKSVWLCLKHEITLMVKQGAGAIVNTASGAGLMGACGAAPYVAAKHGVIGLTKTAAMEYAGDGVRINAVCPGVILTPPLKEALQENPDLVEHLVKTQFIQRVGEPEEVAEAVVWLCSDAASFVTGAALPVDGAMTSGK